MVLPIVERIVSSLSSGLEVLNIECDWTYPIDENLWAEEWESIGSFFTVDMFVNREDFGEGHPGWNIKGYSGWGHSGASVEIEIVISPEYDLRSNVESLRPEFLNVVAHELHHLTQYSAPFQRPDCLPYIEKRGPKTHFEYFISRTEAPAFVIGFRAESDYTGKSIDRLMEEYLLSQQSAGIISSAEQEEILRRWTNHKEWSY